MAEILEIYEAAGTGTHAAGTPAPRALGGTSVEIGGEAFRLRLSFDDLERIDPQMSRGSVMAHLSQWPVPLTLSDMGLFLHAAAPERFRSPREATRFIYEHRAAPAMTAPLANLLVEHFIPPDDVRRRLEEEADGSANGHAG